MPAKRYRIQFPRTDANGLAQDEAWFLLTEPDGSRTRIRFHDYDAIYSRPGLYEQLFYDRLKCNSPAKVAEILKSALDQSRENFAELRVLDLGAGNGLMGEALKRYGVARLIGVDIIEEARRAMERDRPHVYDDYLVSDFCELQGKERESLQGWSLNCLTTVAALGFGDIPPAAFMEAFNQIQSGGWVALNIRNTFLEMRDETGFSRMFRELIFSDYLNLYHLERYRHRLSMDGKPLHYFAIAGRKIEDIPVTFLARHDGSVQVPASPH